MSSNKNKENRRRQVKDKDEAENSLLLDEMTSKKVSEVPRITSFSFYFYNLIDIICENVY